MLGVALLVAPSVASAQAFIRTVGGFYGHDSFQHAIVQTSDDALHEFFFDANAVHESDLGCFGHVVSTASFYADDDHTGHVVVGQANGDLREVFYSSAIGVHQTPPIANLPGIISLGGFYDANSQLRVAVVATSSGKVFAISYRSNVAPQTQLLGTFSNLVAASGFYSDVDKFDHAIVLLSDGSISEIFFSKTIGVHLTQPPLIRVPGAVAIAAFYSPPDAFGHVIVARRDGSISEIFYGSSIGVHLSQPSLAVVGGTVALAAYYSPVDKRAHVIAGGSGAVREIVYGGAATTANRLIVQTMPGPEAHDISPDQSNATALGALNGWSGLTVNLAGDVNALYSVSLNAGVWKSVLNGPWQRLPNSPRYAHSIAVDPNNTSHLAVGERDGDGAVAANGDGLWESMDAGTTWTYTLDPHALLACSSQAIPSVAFSKTSTLFAATLCGIGRKPKGATKFDFSESPSGIGEVTAVTPSASRVWARTNTILLFSDDDGLHWSQRTIPATMAAHDRGDRFSLAAFDDNAYASCCSVTVPKDCGNENQMMVYASSSDSFSLQPVLTRKDKLGNTVTFADGKAKSQLGCSGDGLGGSRFVHGYTVSGVRHLFYSTDEEILEATSFDAGGLVTQWLRPLASNCGGGGCPNQDPVHGDLWDFHLSRDGLTEWVSGDGGVYRRSLNVAPTLEWVTAADGPFQRYAGGPWLTHDEGLHTHLALTLSVARWANLVRLTYPTPDNDGWLWNANGGVSAWRFEGGLGDANWSAADVANTNAMLIVRTPEVATLVSADAALPGNQSAINIPLSHRSSRDGPGFFNFVQSLETETPGALDLDAFALVDLPLQAKVNGTLQPAPGPLGIAPANGSNTVLIRNPTFIQTADIDQNDYKGWSIATSGLPAGAQRVWLSGGHSATVAYLLAVQSGAPHLFKSVGEGLRTSTTWQELHVQDSGGQQPFPPSGILIGSVTCADPSGFDVCKTIYVNPYDPQQLWVLTNAGVRVSTDGGASFSLDAQLTALITHSGKYALTPDFSGGSEGIVRIGQHADPAPTLSDMGFCRTNSQVAVASSIFGGAFFRDESGKWHDLSGLLPKPASPISGVRIDCRAIYAASVGGGLTEITGYRSVP